MHYIEIISDLKDLKEIYQNPYTSPGSYPKYIALRNGECICHACFRENYKYFVEAIREQEKYENGYLYYKPYTEWIIQFIDINWESLLYCDACSTPIESAYEVIDETQEKLNKIKILEEELEELKKDV